MRVEVTSASHQANSLERTPAAAYVLSAEDIRRSGARSLPEALRMVPGVNVARVDSNRWAVSIRGTNDVFATSILVLIDGRSVYTPLFSGTFWDVQDVPIDTIERIEVVRGPGGVTWGANAVNGVINVITKRAEQTQGWRLHATSGTDENVGGTLRYGGRAGDDGWWRAWARGFDRQALQNPAGNHGDDDWSQGRAGFRWDQRLSDSDDLTLSGDFYEGTSHNLIDLVTPAAPFSGLRHTAARLQGGNLLGLWTRTLDEDSQIVVRGYFDHTLRDYPFIEEDRDTFDLQASHHLALGERHRLVWGLSWRHTRVDYGQSFGYRFADDPLHEDILGVFAQDELTLVPERLFFTLGAKFESYEHSSRELQPTARLSWTPAEGQTGWAAWSRAVRSPSEADRLGTFYVAAQPLGPDALIVALTPDEDLEPEIIDAFELGWRQRLTEGLHVDLATFVNRQSDLISREPGTPYMEGSNLIVPYVVTNQMDAVTWGAEVALDWLPREDLRVRSSFSWFRGDLDQNGGSNLTGDSMIASSPRHQASLLVMKDLGSDLQADFAAYYVDALDHGAVPSYLRLDLRTQWRPRTGVIFAIGLQNLFHDGEREFGPSLIGSTNEVEQVFFIEATLDF